MKVLEGYTDKGLVFTFFFFFHSFILEKMDFASLATFIVFWNHGALFSRRLNGLRISVRNYVTSICRFVRIKRAEILLSNILVRILPYFFFARFCAPSVFFLYSCYKNCECLRQTNINLKGASAFFPVDFSRNSSQHRDVASV